MNRIAVVRKTLLLAHGWLDATTIRNGIDKFSLVNQERYNRVSSVMRRHHVKQMNL